MSHELIFRYLFASFFLIWLFYLFILWLLRKQFPLLYCALNPISRLFVFFYFIMNNLEMSNVFLLETITTDSFRFILITHLIMNAFLICLAILKHRQVLQSPRFEFRKLTQQALESILTEVDTFMKETLSDIHKHSEFELGYKNFYFYYERANKPFLYVEYNQANKLAEVNLEFYPIKEFNLMKIQQLMRILYQHNSKNILAPYTRNRSKYVIIAVVCFIVIMLASFVISINGVWWHLSITTQYILMSSLLVIPLFFLFLDALRKPDKSYYLDQNL